MAGTIISDGNLGARDLDAKIPQGGANTPVTTPRVILAPPISRTITDSDLLEAGDIMSILDVNISTAKTLTINSGVGITNDDGYILVRGGGVLTIVEGTATVTTELGSLEIDSSLGPRLVKYSFTSTSAMYLWNGQPISLTSNDIINALGYTPSKRILLYKEVTPAPHTGNTTETVLGQYLVPGGTLQATDILVVRARIAKTNTNGSYNGRLRIGTLGTTGDAQVGIVSPGATQLHSYFKRDIHFIDSVSSQEILPTTLNAATDEQTSTAAPSALTIDFSVNQYISFSINLNNGSDVGILKYIYMEIIRS